MQNIVRSILFTVVLSALLLIGSAQRRGQNSRHRAEQEILDSIIKPEVRINPGGNETHVGATTVRVDMYVRSIDVLDEENQELNLQLTLRMRWFDSRLSYSQSNSEGLKYVSLQGSDVNKVWLPDLFVGNEKNAQVHDFSLPNRFVRISPNGELYYSQRVSLSTICALNYRNFPFDRQQCQLRLASYSNTNQDISFEWQKTNPVQIIRTLTLPQFVYESHETGTCHAETTTGVYSCINVTFNLRRAFNYYLVHIFIPLTMLSIISWLAFWIAPKDLVSRLIVTLVSLSLMVIQVSNFNSSTPHVSYTRAIDNFTGISLTFAFWSLIETIIVNYWVRTESSSENGGAGAGNGEAVAKVEEIPEPEAEPLKPSGDVESGKAGVEEPGKKRQRPHPEKFFQSRYSALKSTSEKIDWVNRIVYPVLGVVFYIIFFSVAATRN